VVTWTLGSALVLRVRRGPVAVAGALLTLCLATIAGSLHGAHVVGGVHDLLLANASAMAGPMLLCSVFVLTSAVRRPAPRPAPRPALRAATEPARILAGAGAALGSLAFCEWMSRSTPAPQHLLDNSFAFGFGFATQPAGSAVVALLIALLTVRVMEKVADPM
jgi:hypothetical protein